MHCCHHHCRRNHTSLPLLQTARKIHVAKFRAGRVGVLITTDVAARGIDIPLIDNVINYDFPAKPELFVHRWGCAALCCAVLWSVWLWWWTTRQCAGHLASADVCALHALLSSRTALACSQLSSQGCLLLLRWTARAFSHHLSSWQNKT